MGCDIAYDQDNVNKKRSHIQKHMWDWNRNLQRKTGKEKQSKFHNTTAQGNEEERNDNQSTLQNEIFKISQLRHKNDKIWK